MEGRLRGRRCVVLNRDLPRYRTRGRGDCPRISCIEKNTEPILDELGEMSDRVRELHNRADVDRGVPAIKMIDIKMIVRPDRNMGTGKRTGIQRLQRFQRLQRLGRQGNWAVGDFWTEAGRGVRGLIG
jgi:hypothetical protein